MKNGSAAALTSIPPCRIGRATVLALAKRGVSTIFTYNSHAEEAEAVVKEVTSLGVRAHAIQLDISSTSAFDGFVKNVLSIAQTWGRSTIDYLIPSAGNGPVGPVASMNEETVDQLFAIHFKHPFFLSQKFLPHIEDGAGRIINVSTGLARFSMGPYAAYAGMKGGIEVYTKYLAQELGGRGIRVNCVRSGVLGTDFGGGRNRDDANMRKMLGEKIALGRVGEAEEVGDVIAALTGDEMRWVNGTVIEVSGGQSL